MGEGDYSLCNSDADKLRSPYDDTFQVKDHHKNPQNIFSVEHIYLFCQVEGPAATRMHPAASVQAPLTHFNSFKNKRLSHKIAKANNM